MADEKTSEAADAVKDEAGEASEAPAAPEPPKGFGAQLRAAREALGISLGDMAVRSRLSVQQVRALEEEDLSALPEPVYIRAFIRGCARSLGLDPQALSDDFMARYGRGPGVNGGQIPASDPSREEVISAAPKHRSLKLSILIGLVAVVTAGLWAVYTDQFAGVHTGSEAQKIETGSDADAARKPSGEAAAPAAPAPAPAESKAGEPAADSAEVAGKSQAAGEAGPQSGAATAETAERAQANSSAQAAQAAQVAQPAQTAQAGNAAAASERKPLPPAGSVELHRVEFRVTDACWVQVISPSGRNLLAKEMTPANAAPIDVPKGARFTIGNAAAMRLVIDGKPRDVSSMVRNGVARFTIE